MAADTHRLSGFFAFFAPDLLERITITPYIFRGKPIIRGMRISVEMILDLLAQEVSEKEILEDYSMLEPDDLHACLFYASSFKQ